MTILLLFSAIALSRRMFICKKESTLPSVRSIKSSALVSLSQTSILIRSFFEIEPAMYVMSKPVSASVSQYTTDSSICSPLIKILKNGSHLSLAPFIYGSSQPTIFPAHVLATPPKNANIRITKEAVV